MLTPMSMYLDIVFVNVFLDLDLSQPVHVLLLNTPMVDPNIWSVALMGEGEKFGNWSVSLTAKLVNKGLSIT